MDSKHIKIIKDTVEEFFYKMTFDVLSVSAESCNEKENESVDVFVKLDEPQVLIGQNGQTLTEIQKILKIILNKKIKLIFFLNLDINDYKKKKSEYLKRLARDLADEVSFSKKEKAMLPMAPYERRVIHSELAGRADVKTESRGDGQERYIVVMPK